MRRTYTPSVIHVAAIVMAFSIFLVGKISCQFPGGGSSQTQYCTINPSYCQTVGGQKRQIREVRFLHTVYLLPLSMKMSDLFWRVSLRPLQWHDRPIREKKIRKLKTFLLNAFLKFVNAANARYVSFANILSGYAHAPYHIQAPLISSPQASKHS